MNQGKFAVIVAGGKGLRMQSETPKQFMTLKGIPVLIHTVNAFFFADPTIEIILVIPEVHFDTWTTLVSKHSLKVPHRLVKGGNTRFQSVKKGIASIEGEGVVAIHDGVRPLVSKDLIVRSFSTAAETGSAIVTVTLKDSIRKKSSEGSFALSRNDYCLVQTPQTFALVDIKKAYQIEEQDIFTDDASVFESSGKKVNLIEGDYRNIKITTQEDIAVAEVFLEKI